MLDTSAQATKTIQLQHDLVNHQQSGYQAALLVTAKQSQCHIRMNCANVERIDMSGVKLLLSLKQALNKNQRELYFCNLPKTIQVYFELIQADKLLLVEECQGVAA